MEFVRRLVYLTELCLNWASKSDADDSRATSYSSLYAISLYRCRAPASVSAVEFGTCADSAPRTVSINTA